MKWYFCIKCNEWYKEEEAEKFERNCPECDGLLIATCHKCMKPEKLCRCRKE
jgi:predicted RNA-binding Zn-ribbon protein involved in translation (DUF1610 family)